MSTATPGFSFAGSCRHFSRAAEMIPGGVNSPVRAFRSVGGNPVFLSRAKGSRFWDVDGNEFVDFCQSWGPLILGHSDERVVEAVRRAAGRGLSFGTCHAGEVQMAEMILSALKEFDCMRLVNSGTEAVMTALRLARGVTGRDLVLKFGGGYHGHSDSMLVKAGSGLATAGVADSRGVPTSVAEGTLVAGLDDEESVKKLFDTFASRIAAVIVEPLPANNGLLVQRGEFLQFLRNITRKNGTLLIFDEVISGFRLHFGGYYQLVEIVPDLVTLGKIIGGGMPVGAVVGPGKTMRNLAPEGNVYQAGTLSGNPVSLAAGIETLRILSDSRIYEQLENLGSAFASMLEGSGRHDVHVQRAGSIVWPYLDGTELPRRPEHISDSAMERYRKLFWSVLNRGLYLPPSPYEVLFLSVAHSEQELKRLADTLLEQLHTQQKQPLSAKGSEK
ncbi:MAG: aspartate aminotransferase family protein [Chitinispirillaceae bacterium]